MLAVAHAHRAELDAREAFDRAKRRMQVLHVRHFSGQAPYRKLRIARAAFYHAVEVFHAAVLRHTRLYRAHVHGRSRLFFDDAADRREQARLDAANRFDDGGVQ